MWLLLCMGFGGCAHTPLDKAINQVAPDYSAKKPATDMPMLGHRIVTGGLDTVACYQGKVDPNTGTSWDRIKLIYTGNSEADLSADFGNTIKVAMAGSRNINSTIVLEGLAEDQLTELYMNPRSTCAASPKARAEYASESGFIDKVVVRAVRAKKVTITALDKGSMRAEVNVPVVQGVPVHVKGSSSAADDESWEGTRLYFAHLIQPFRTTLVSKPFPEISVPGSTGKLQECAFKITGLGDNLWTGALNCDGGGPGLDNLRARFDEPDGRQTAPGVSYSVVVSPSARAGYVDVEVLKWIVEQVR